MQLHAGSAVRVEQRAGDGIWLSLVVPVYNGGSDIIESVRRLQAFRAKQRFRSELIIVDDGSRTPVLATIGHSGLDLSGIQVLRNDRNRGKGFSVVRGMVEAQGRYRVFTDADLAYPPSQITKIIDALRDGADIAVASRLHPDSRPAWNPSLWRRSGRYVMGRLFNAAVQGVVLGGFADTQAGLKGFTAAAAAIVFPRLSVQRFAFDVEALVVARRHRLRVAQTAVMFHVANCRTTIRVVRDTVRNGAGSGGRPLE